MNLDQFLSDVLYKQMDVVDDIKQIFSQLWPNDKEKKQP